MFGFSQNEKSQSLACMCTLYLPIISITWQRYIFMAFNSQEKMNKNSEEIIGINEKLTKIKTVRCSNLYAVEANNKQFELRKVAIL